jgi:hypothetical protein
MLTIYKSRDVNKGRTLSKEGKSVGRPSTTGTPRRLGTPAAADTPEIRLTPTTHEMLQKLKDRRYFRRKKIVKKTHKMLIKIVI